jgi:glycosyltransferase involved in cell wall biosynthesis
MNIVFASHTAIGGPFVVGSHHLAQQFAGMGHSVLHLSTPLTPFHVLKMHDSAIQNRFEIWRKGGITRREGLVEYGPLALVPWQLSRCLLDWTNLLLWCIPTVPQALQGAGFRKVDVLLVDQPRMVGIEDIVSPDKLVYRATDLYPGDRHVAKAEARLVEKADLVVGTSKPVVDHLQALCVHKRALLLENGVDVEHIAVQRPMPSEYHTVPAPKAIYVGALDARLNFAIIRDLCLEIPQLTVILIGPLSNPLPQALIGLRNLVLLGARPYDSIPAFLQHAEVGLLPLTSHPSNTGRSPMKLYEYGAAGLCVVATATPELSRRALPFVALARDASEFVANVRTVLENPKLLAERRRTAKEISATMDWNGIAQKLLREIVAP